MLHILISMLKRILVLFLFSRICFLDVDTLCGVKIIGDPNVPGNKVSFILDISHRLDIDIAIEQDSRPGQHIIIKNS